MFFYYDSIIMYIFPYYTLIYDIYHIYIYTKEKDKYKDIHHKIIT
jgi:hypothetical protein